MPLFLRSTKFQISAAAAIALLLAGTAPAVRAVGALRLQRWRSQFKLRVSLAEQAKGDWESLALERRPDVDADAQSGEGESGDDALLRRAANLAYWGPRGASFQRDLMQTAHAEAQRAPQTLPGAAAASFVQRLSTLVAGGAIAPAAAIGPSAQSWTSLGPTNERIAWNGGSYSAIDSGRPNTIRVDPRDSRVVYVATSGGGVWKSYDFAPANSPPATWLPITETIGNLAIGALDLDPQAPDTLWIGTGDFVDVAGGQVLRSLDGGGTWSAPIPLSGAYTFGGSTMNVTASTVRDLKVDPSSSARVLVATEVGLFLSTNANQASPTFSLVALPNPTPVADAAWTIAWLGGSGATSSFAVSGIAACAANQYPPGPGGASVPGTAGCTSGTLGDIWTTADGGATWASARVAGKFSSITATTGELGRIALAASPVAASPATATIWAEAGYVDEGSGGRLAAILRSADGGASYTAAASIAGVGSASNTTPTNPNPADCPDLNLPHDQAWYNLAVAVDPGNPRYAIFGGNLCGARTSPSWTPPAAPTFDLVSHWLAGGGLPYVHADWHAATIVRVNGVAWTFAGTDGGIFFSSDVATAASPTWSYDTNIGLTTHLAYSIGSGDPADGNGFVAFTGLQDNGTRFRDDVAGGSPTTFNQVNGGDGFGATAANDGTGLTNYIYWSSVYGGNTRLYCKPALTGCNAGGAWTGVPLTLPTGDSEPFIQRFAPVNDAASSVITMTTQNVWKRGYADTTWTRLTSSALPGTLRNVGASPFTYTIGGTPGIRLYGAALTGGKYAVLQDNAGTIAVSSTPNPQGTGVLGTSDPRFVRGTSSISFPKSAANFGTAAQDGKTFLACSVAPTLSDGTAVPAAMGHVFLTRDGGTTWSAFHGNGTSDLPNVPCDVVRFDPGDATDRTVYVGTDLGLYASYDQGATWQRFGVGLPMVKVTDLFIGRNGGLLRASTYGRGLWEIYPNATARGVAGDGDWDRNLQIDFLDLGALASRLGTTPATSATPLYDWNLDLVGAQNALDDADLTALLAKFGSHP